MLVTGGAGYIGSHTCKVLAAEGYRPVVYDNLVYGHRWAVKWGPFEHGDVRDVARLVDVIDAYRPVGIIHFAAYTYVGESVENPSKYYTNNLAGSLGVAEAMRQTGIRSVVFSSTCATYGAPESVPIDERHPQRPVNPYGFTKYAIEQMLADYARAYRLAYAALRYFNAAGADPEGEIGEDHRPETHLIPLAIRAALDDDYTLQVFGTRYDTPDGTAIRDYVHVTDLARAHVASLEHLQRTGESFAVNLGTGTGHSVAEVIASVEKMTGRSLDVNESAPRPGDPPILVADKSKAEQILSWAPQFETLDEIVRTAVRWHRTHRGSR